MEVLDKIEKVVHALKEMNCKPKKILIKDSVDGRVYITLQYRNAVNIDKAVFNKLMNDNHAELHTPSLQLTGHGTKKNKNNIDIFY